MIQIFAEILKIFKFQTKMFVIYFKIFSSCFTCDKKSRALFELKITACHLPLFSQSSYSFAFISSS